MEKARVTSKKAAKPLHSRLSETATKLARDTARLVLPRGAVVVEVRQDQVRQKPDSVIRVAPEKTQVQETVKLVVQPETQ
jgi:hypothetical protein